MAKQRHTRFDCNAGCAVEATVSLIDGKWKCVILNTLLAGTIRFGELHRQMPGVTPRMLTSQLRKLEVDGLIVWTMYAQVPPKVEYPLSDLGRSLEPVIAGPKAWGSEHLHLFSKINGDLEVDGGSGCSVLKKEAEVGGHRSAGTVVRCCRPMAVPCNPLLNLPGRNLFVAMGGMAHTGCLVWIEGNPAFL